MPIRPAADNYAMQHVPFRHREDGVSVIVGTLLLILVAVTAVAGFALMVSQMQKDTMIRQSHLADVQNEALKIQSIELRNDRNEWNLTMKNETNSEGNWSFLRFTLINLNTKDSSITGIGIKPGNAADVRYAYNYSSAGTTYNLSQYLVVPAAKSGVVDLSLVSNFTPSGPIFPVRNPVYLHEDDSITIRVITAFQNVIEVTFKPPVPVIRTRFESEDLTVAQRSILVLDGSDSADDGTVVKWDWAILDGSRTFPEPGTWDDTANVTSTFSEGKVVRLTLPNSGPFRVGLTVTDDTGMTGSSGLVTIPRNPGFNPPVGLFIDKFGDVINVTVRDIENKPVSGSAVSFVKTTDPYGNLSLSTWSAMTDIFGNVSTMKISGTGTIRVISGKLPPVDVAV